MVFFFIIINPACEQKTITLNASSLAEIINGVIVQVTLVATEKISVYTTFVHLNISETHYHLHMHS